jgi:Zn-dependent protease with chaperone function
VGARIRKVVSLDSLVMYIVALAFELPAFWARSFVVGLLATIVFAIKEGDPYAGLTLALWIALAPTLWSIFAMITPRGFGWWWKARLGGREPSSRERSSYVEAFESLQMQAPAELASPRSWFVLDTPEPDAAVCGDALMLSRGLLESGYLVPVLAHELGHLASTDGRLTAAINRLVLWEPRAREHRQVSARDLEPFILGTLIMWLRRIVIALVRGGVGLRLARPLLGNYWRQCEYRADRYAASLGQADELADFLELHALVNDHPVPFIWLSEHTHPPTELRIDRLRGLAVATRSEPVKPAPSGRLRRGLTAASLTEPDRSAEKALRWAGQALPTTDDENE